MEEDVVKRFGQMESRLEATLERLDRLEEEHRQLQTNVEIAGRAMLTSAEPSRCSR